jgi:outer membrane protein TolC
MSKKTFTTLRLTALICVATLFVAASADTVSLSADKAADFAQKQSLAVKASELAIESYQKSVQGAKASFFPTLNGTANYSHLFAVPSAGSSMSLDTSFFGSLEPGDKIVFGSIMKMFENLASASSSPDNIFSLGFTIGQPIYAGGRIANAYKISKLSHENQLTGHNRTLVTVGYNAKKMYWSYVGMLKSLESIREVQIWLTDLASMQQKMFSNDMIIELDLLNTKIQLDNYKLTELKTQNAILNFADQMLLFLGLPTGSVIEADTSELEKKLDTFTQPSDDEINTILDARDDLKVLKKQMEVLKLSRKIQFGSYLPTIAGFVNNNYSNQYSEDELQRTTTAGLTLNWAIIDWGKNYREIEKTDIQLKTLELSYNNTREQLRLKIISLARAVIESRKALDISKEDLETAKKALDISKLKYDAQAITNTDLLNSRNLLTSKYVNYTQAQINTILALEEYRTIP